MVTSPSVGDKMKELYATLASLVTNSKYGEIDIDYNHEHYSKLFEYFMLDMYNCRYQTNEHHKDFVMLDDLDLSVLILDHDINITFTRDGQAGSNQLEYFTVENMTLEDVMHDKQKTIQHHLDYMLTNTEDLKFLNDVRTRKYNENTTTTNV